MTAHPAPLAPLASGTSRTIATLRRVLRQRVEDAKVGEPSGIAPPKLSRQTLGRLLRAVTDGSDDVVRTPTAAELDPIPPGTRTRAVLSEQLVDGRSTPQALVACVKDLTGTRDYREAQALISAARRIPNLSEAAHAGGSVMAVARGRLCEAEHHLRGVSRQAALDLVPDELVAVELSLNPAWARATRRTLSTRTTG